MKKIFFIISILVFVFLINFSPVVAQVPTATNTPTPTPVFRCNNCAATFSACGTFAGRTNVKHRLCSLAGPDLSGTVSCIKVVTGSSSTAEYHQVVACPTPTPTVTPISIYKCTTPCGVFSACSNFTGHPNSKRRTCTYSTSGSGGALTCERDASGAYYNYQSCPTPTPTRTPTPTPKISWKTEHVSLEADDFYIIANGEKFLGNNASLIVSSDPPDPPSENYTTLEAIWKENKKEMRLFIYFSKDEKNWWSNEMRTYNAKVSPDWIYYKKGKYFETPVGQTWKGKAELFESPDGSGKIYFLNPHLRAFLKTPTKTPTPTPIKPTIDPLCACSANACNTTHCSFSKHTGTTYNTPIKCQLVSSLFKITPAPAQKKTWCQRYLRTKGDADGEKNSAGNYINMFDYYYYVGAVNGGKIPVNVNPDFNGDGEVGVADRVIIMKSL
ncbi:MAG: hypothetical protein V1803_02915 [Candidatus Roizmanbacteria bacterium]